MKRFDEDDLVPTLAALLLRLDVGQRLPSLRSLALKHGASLGGVHRALAHISDSGAAEIERHGRGGSILTARSTAMLFDIVRTDPFIVALSLPGSLHMAGLATAIKAAFAKVGIPTYLAFYGGTRERVNALRRNLCDVAVVSALAARGEHGVETFIELPAGSYVAGHLVFFQGVAKEALRVAIDHDSTDLELLAEMEFGHTNPKFVTTTYMQFARLLGEGEIDAAIWNADEPVRIPSSVQTRELSPGVLRELDEANTKAAILIRASDQFASAVLRAALRPDELIRIQSEVVNDERTPEY